MVVDIVSRIPILEKRHNNERSVIKNVGAEKLCVGKQISPMIERPDEKFIRSHGEYGGGEELTMSEEVS
jgi:hypothetical protein